jgi:hypothetical protein
VRARKSCVAAVNCLFAEFDAHSPGDDKRALLDRIAGLDPRPSVIVDSGGGYHCYWLLAETFEIETEQERQWIDSLQKGWVTYAGGDEGAKDLARMLRLPGTRNWKYAPPRPVRWIKHDLDQMYALSELERRARAAAPKRRTAGAQERSVRRQPTLALVGQTAEWLDRLAQWRCDEYEPWIEVGMALSELGDLGLTLWDLWSQKSAKYEPGVCVEKWGTFTPGDGLTLGSLRYWADEDDPRSQDTGSEPRELEPAAVHSDLSIQRLRAREVRFVQDPLPQLRVETGCS